VGGSLAIGPFALDASLAVVVLGLLASAGWGLSDFGGGLATKRAPVFGVLVLSQLAGLGLVVPLAVVRGEPPLAQTDVLASVAAGVLGAIGLTFLYEGLSIGRMGVVAPVAGVLTALIPVVVGIVVQGFPGPAAMAGIGLAVAGVMLVSRAPGHPGGGPSGIRYGLLAGVGFGCFAVAVSRVGEGHVLVPMAIIRAAATVLVLLLVLVRRPAWRVPRPLLPLVAGVGAMDMTATLFYLAAIETGPLAIAAVLAALYPVMTVILAAVVLRERITAVHGLGIAAAAVAIVLISSAAR
jgi:drug/metabolite transporter (DMT)-like permease